MGSIAKIERYYLFYGTDEYSKWKRIKSLVSLAIKKGFEDFDYSCFDGRGLDAASLINAASTPPFGSPLRVVILRDLDRVSPKGVNLIEKFIGFIPDYTTLVMTSIKSEKSAFGQKKLDRRKKIYKTLFNNKKSCREFSEPPPASAVKEVLETASELKLNINTETASYLVETVGCDIGRLDRELEKLLLYVEKDTAITVDQIALVAGTGTVGTPFDLPEKIVEGDSASALRILHNLLLSKNQEGTILFRIKDYFLNLNMVILRGSSSGYLVKRLSLLPKTANSLLKASKRLSSVCITNCLHIIYESETSLKSAGLKKDTILIELVSRLGIQIGGNKTQR